MTEKKILKAADIDSSDELDLRYIFGLILDSRWLVLGVTSLFAVFGILYVLFASPIYKADALIQVEQNPKDSLLNDISTVIPGARPQSDTEIELIKSRMVIGKTVKDLHLDLSVEKKYFPVLGKGFSRLIKAKNEEIEVTRFDIPSDLIDEEFELEVLSDNKYRLTSEDGIDLVGVFDKESKESGISFLVKNVNASIGAVFRIKKFNELTAINNVLVNLTVVDKGKDTGVLQLSYESEDRKETIAVLNSISTNYFQQNVDRKSEEAAKSLTFLKQQLPEVSNTLENSENRLNYFREKNESVDLPLEAKSLLDTMVAVESQLNELTFKEAEISKLYTKAHPAYRALLEKRGTLEDERNRVNKKVADMPKTQQEILRLTRDVQVGQEVYMQLLNKQQELNINKASTIGNVRIVDTALAQLKPVKPQKKLIVLIVTLLGAISACLFVVLRAVLHKGIESPEQLEEHGISVYASIPLSEWQNKQDREGKLLRNKKKDNVRSTDLLAVGNPADLAIEAIRSLRTSLHFAMMSAKNNVLVISGSSPEIGKTFVSANLSAVIAQSGQRVLLVDCDMRKGYAHALMNTDSANGLSEILSKQVSPDNAVRKTNISNMDFIPRGQIPPNPSELLMAPTLGEFVRWAEDNYDIVLLDTPPILAVTDAAIISSHAGSTLLVARFEMNTLKEVEVSIRRFEQNGTEVKGVILNAIVRRAASYYAYGNYDYYAYEYKSEK